MDPLSDIFALLQVRSVLSARLEGAGPWALRFPAYRHIKFGGVIEGDRWLWIDGTDDVRKLEAGDFYLLTDGRPYCFASVPDAPLIDSRDGLPSEPDADGVIRFGQGAPRTVGAGGRFTLDDETGRLLLDALPPIIHIRSRANGTRALRSALELIAFETDQVRPGASTMAASLANIVLVNILRAYLAEDGAPVGWLGALGDTRIAHALSLMHGEGARRWRLDELAQACAMSRTRFAERFKERVGLPPLEYLTRWRMTLACKALTVSGEPLAVIAGRVGYDSDTAFSLAFKRRHGISPGRYRLQARQAREAVSR